MRANAPVTRAITVLAVLCSLASLSNSFHPSSPQVHLEVLSIDTFQRHKGGNDEVRLTMNISADLSSVFSWNTKQVSLWDAILVLNNFHTLCSLHFSINCESMEP